MTALLLCQLLRRYCRLTFFQENSEIATGFYFPVAQTEKYAYNFSITFSLMEGLYMLLKNATIYDGIHAEPIQGDLAIREGKIAAVGSEIAPLPGCLLYTSDAADE